MDLEQPPYMFCHAAEGKSFVFEHYSEKKVQRTASSAKLLAATLLLKIGCGCSIGGHGDLL